MKRLVVMSAGLALAAVPAVYGLTGNPALSHNVPVRIPVGAASVPVELPVKKLNLVETGNVLKGVEDKAGDTVSSSDGRGSRGSGKGGSGTSGSGNSGSGSSGSGNSGSGNSGSGTSGSGSSGSGSSGSGSSGSGSSGSGSSGAVPKDADTTSSSPDDKKGETESRTKDDSGTSGSGEAPDHH